MHGPRMDILYQETIVGRNLVELGAVRHGIEASERYSCCCREVRTAFGINNDGIGMESPYLSIWRTDNVISFFHGPT